jgi:hypothetical protein
MNGRLLALPLLLGVTLAQAQGSRPETPLLSESEYRSTLEEVVVRAQRPATPEQAPRWDRPKIELELESGPSRLEWAPRYVRDEREDYEGVRDRTNAEPRIKVFEVRF